MSKASEWRGLKATCAEPLRPAFKVKRAGASVASTYASVDDRGDFQTIGEPTSWLMPSEALALADWIKATFADAAPSGEGREEGGA